MQQTVTMPCKFTESCDEPPPIIPRQFHLIPMSRRIFPLQRVPPGSVKAPTNRMYRRLIITVSIHSGEEVARWNWSTMVEASKHLAPVNLSDKKISLNEAGSQRKPVYLSSACSLLCFPKVLNRTPTAATTQFLNRKIINISSHLSSCGVLQIKSRAVIYMHADLPSSCKRMEISRLIVR